MTNSFFELVGEATGDRGDTEGDGSLPVFPLPTKKQREKIYNSVNLSTLFWFAF